MKNYIVIAFVGLSFLCVGCDQLKTFAGYFSKRSSAPEAASEAQPIAPVEPAKNSMPATPLTPNVLAKVGSWTLTVDEFKQRLQSLKEVIPEFDTRDPEAITLVLEELIRQQMLVIDAEQTGLAANKDLQDAVEEFRRTLLVREVANNITQGVEATGLEAQDYYNQNLDLFKGVIEYHIREIIVKEQQAAKDLLVQLLQGADFAQIAQQSSTAASAAQGGDLGFVSAFADNPQMDNVVKSLAIGDVSSVFSGPEGFYIIKLEEKKEGGAKPFAEVEEDIKTGLTLMKQQQAILNHLDQLRNKISLQINEQAVTRVQQELTSAEPSAVVPDGIQPVQE